MKKNIVVIGDGVAGLSVACLLAKQLPSALASVTVIRSSDASIEHPEFTRSAIHRFHDLIGLPEKNIILNCNANFGLGVWCQSVERDYILAEGMYGSAIDGLDFLSAFSKCVRADDAYRLDDFSINAVAAREGRFGHPAADPTSIYSVIQYGLHVEPTSYSALLRDHATALGVIFAAAAFNKINKNEQGLSSIELEDGKRITADLYVNCSVKLGPLLDNKLARDDGLDTIFDSMAYGYSSQSPNESRATQLTHDKDGFLKVIPLKNSAYVCYVYSSRHSSLEQVQEKLTNAGVKAISVAQLNRFQHGYSYWANNCVDLARAPSLNDLFVSPHEILRNSAVRLLDLLASFDDFSAEAAEYNRLADAEYKQLHEFVELNLFLVRDSVAAVTDYFKSNNLSAGAQHRYDLFNAYGRHPASIRKIFSDTEWAMLWLGNKVFPKTSNPGSQIIESERIIKQLNNLKEFIYRAVDKMPRHNDYLARATH